MKSKNSVTTILVLGSVLLLLFVLSAEALAAEEPLNILYEGPFTLWPDDDEEGNVVSETIPVQLGDGLTTNDIQLKPVHLSHTGLIQLDPTKFIVEFAKDGDDKLHYLQVRISKADLFEKNGNPRVQGEYGLTVLTEPSGEKSTFKVLNLGYPETKLIYPKKIFIEIIKKLFPPCRKEPGKFAFHLQVEEGPDIRDVVISQEQPAVHEGIVKSELGIEGNSVPFVGAKKFETVELKTKEKEGEEEFPIGDTTGELSIKAPGLSLIKIPFTVRFRLSKSHIVFFAVIGIGFGFGIRVVWAGWKFKVLLLERIEELAGQIEQALALATDPILKTKLQSLMAHLKEVQKQVEEIWVFRPYKEETWNAIIEKINQIQKEFNDALATHERVMELFGQIQETWAHANDPILKTALESLIKDLGGKKNDFENLLKKKIARKEDWDTDIEKIISKIDGTQREFNEKLAEFAMPLQTGRPSTITALTLWRLRKRQVDVPERKFKKRMIIEFVELIFSAVVFSWLAYIIFMDSFTGTTANKMSVFAWGFSLDLGLGAVVDKIKSMAPSK